MLNQVGGMKFAEFDLKAVAASLHPALPDTPLWAYDGRVPGPTVVVDPGDHVHTRVVNRIGSTLPYAHVVVTDDTPGTGTTTRRVRISPQGTPPTRQNKNRPPP